MHKMFHVNYSQALCGVTSGLGPELRACRACLATDTKLFPLSPGLAEAYEHLLGTQTDGRPQHVCSYCAALLRKFARFQGRCVRARRLVDAAILELQYQPITTNFVRSIDRMSHSLLLEFTLGLDAKVIYLAHQDSDDDNNDDDVNIKANDEQYDDDKTIIDMDDTDGLTDVLNDFEEIRNSMNDEVDINFNDTDFNDINEDNDSRNRTFNDHVEGLFSGKEMNNLDDLIEKHGFDSKCISNNDLVDIINTEFSGKAVIRKSLEESSSTAAKKVVNKEINSTVIGKKNLNINLPDEINFTDVSINTNDLNENDNSNLVDAFNNFILDHDYLDEKFLIETGEADSAKKQIVSKKTDEESLLREIVPKMTKKEKKLVIKEIENNDQVKIKKPKIKLTGILKNIKKHKSKLVKEDTIEEDNSSTIPFTVNDNNDTKELTGDLIQFGDDFNFRIFFLTREEQLEELEKKKEGVLYLGAPYKCAMCAKGFRSPTTYSNHMKIHDPSHGEFPCSVCQSRFASGPRRRRHAAAHRLKLCCTRCEFVARTREKAMSHFEWHAGRRFPCEHCGDTFGKLSTLLSHVRLRHAGACASCALCGEAFVGARGLRLHRRRAHAVTEPNHQELVEWYCFSCRLQFANQQAFERHRAVSGCSPHSQACGECGEGCKSAPALLRHRRLAHPPAPLQCQMCDATFANAMSRDTHHERVHLNVRWRKQDSAVRVKSAARPNVEKRKVMCEICGNKYHSAAALLYHQRSHTGERPYACARCPKSFALPHSLQAHVRTHTGERPHRCSKCARAFRNANNLARHNNTVHLGHKQRWRCGACRRWLASRAALRRHAAAQHRALPWPAPP